MPSVSSSVTNANDNITENPNAEFEKKTRKRTGGPDERGQKRGREEKRICSFGRECQERGKGERGKGGRGKGRKNKLWKALASHRGRACACAHFFPAQSPQEAGEEKDNPKGKKSCRCCCCCCCCCCCGSNGREAETEGEGTKKSRFSLRESLWLHFFLFGATGKVGRFFPLSLLSRGTPTLRPPHEDEVVLFLWRTELRRRRAGQREGGSPPSRSQAKASARPNGRRGTSAFRRASTARRVAHPPSEEPYVDFFCVPSIVSGSMKAGSPPRGGRFLSGLMTIFSAVKPLARLFLTFSSPLSPSLSPFLLSPSITLLPRSPLEASVPF